MHIPRLFWAVTLGVLLPITAVAGEHFSMGSGSSCCDSPSRWASRHPVRERLFAIDTENGKGTLLITREVLALQLSDRTMHKLDRELRDEKRDRHDEPLVDVLKAAVLGGVRRLLDHSAECDLRDVRSVDYRNGRLVILDTAGDRLFEGVEMEDDRVLENFSERDALAFIREFRAAKSQRR